MTHFYRTLFGLVVAFVGVPTLKLQAQDLSSLQARALIEAVDQAVLSSELAGKIIKLPFEEGTVFKKGDLLAAFDCRSYKAQLAVETAGVTGTKKKLANLERLYKLGSAAQLDIDLAKADLQRMNGMQQQARVLTQKCNITAPFSGKVVERLVRVHESLSPGDQIMEILNHEKLDIKMVVPSTWLSWLKVGTEFRVKIDETGYIFPASVARIGARIDPVSQTIKVIAHVNKPDQLLPGMSGNALFTPAVQN